jgi:hypothetical protein
MRGSDAGAPIWDSLVTKSRSGLAEFESQKLSSCRHACRFSRRSHVLYYVCAAFLQVRMLKIPHCQIPIPRRWSCTRSWCVDGPVSKRANIYFVFVKPCFKPRRNHSITLRLQTIHPIGSHSFYPQPHFTLWCQSTQSSAQVIGRHGDSAPQRLPFVELELLAERAWPWALSHNTARGVRHQYMVGAYLRDTYLTPAKPSVSLSPATLTSEPPSPSAGVPDDENPAQQAQPRSAETTHPSSSSPLSTPSSDQSHHNPRSNHRQGYYSDWSAQQQRAFHSLVHIRSPSHNHTVVSALAMAAGLVRAVDDEQSAGLCRIVHMIATDAASNITAGLPSVRPDTPQNSTEARAGFAPSLASDDWDVSHALAKHTERDNAPLPVELQYASLRRFVLFRRPAAFVPSQQTPADQSSSSLSRASSAASAATPIVFVARRATDHVTRGHMYAALHCQPVALISNVLGCFVKYELVHPYISFACSSFLKPGTPCARASSACGGAHSRSIGGGMIAARTRRSARCCTRSRATCTANAGEARRVNDKWELNSQIASR